VIKTFGELKIEGFPAADDSEIFSLPSANGCEEFLLYRKVSEEEAVCIGYRVTGRYHWRNLISYQGTTRKVKKDSSVLL
jgi:hypothetical protein